MEPINSPRKDIDYHFTNGYISLHQKDYVNAISHLEKLRKDDIYGNYLLAKAYEGAGNKDKADAIFKTLVNYNFNGVGYALIRNELKKKM